MVSRFWCCTAITAVAIVAGIGSTGIMHPGAAHKGGGGMAIMAIQAGYKMSRVDLGILTFRGITIMTGFAVIHYTTMIEHRADESAGVMTDTTVLTGGQVSIRLAYGKTGIMA